MSAEPIDPLTELPAPLVRMLAVKIDPYSNTKPLDDFFRALMRHHDFCMKQKAAEASQQSRARRSPTTMNAETDNAKTENATIENALTVVNLKPPAVITDGWDAAAIDMAANPMKGMASAIFDNGAFFTGKEKLLIKPEQQFIAIDVREGYMFLKKATPPEFVMRPLGGPKPSRPDSFTDEESWPFKFDSKTERDDFWKYNRFVFLLDPQSAQVTVFNTHTFGGDIGVNELVKAIQTMRTAHPGAVPIVQLESQQWKTKFGMRPRPFFAIMGWHFKDNAPQPLADSNGQGGGPIKTVNTYDDEIPF